MGQVKTMQNNIFFICEDIWSMKWIMNEALNITQLETTFRGRALTWYMKYKTTVPTGKTRSLTKIKRDLLRDF
jgi:pyruvate/oxaloacetate carboxyltransferase